jgi:hypothetical protein
MIKKNDTCVNNKWTFDTIMAPLSKQNTLLHLCPVGFPMRKVIAATPGFMYFKHLLYIDVDVE